MDRAARVWRIPSMAAVCVAVECTTIHCASRRHALAAGMCWEAPAPLPEPLAGDDLRCTG